MNIVSGGQIKYYQEITSACLTLIKAFSKNMISNLRLYQFIKCYLELKIITYFFQLISGVVFSNLTQHKILDPFPCTQYSSN